MASVVKVFEIILRFSWPLSVLTSVRMVRFPLTPAWISLTWSSAIFGSSWRMVLYGTTSVVTSNSGFTSTKLGLPSCGIAVASTLLPTAIISETGSWVTVFDLTWRLSLPLSLVTSAKMVRSPATPAWITCVCPFGKFWSSWRMVSKGMDSLLISNSGFTSTKLGWPWGGIDVDSSEDGRLGVAGVSIIPGWLGIKVCSSRLPWVVFEGVTRLWDISSLHLTK